MSSCMTFLSLMACIKYLMWSSTGVLSSELNFGNHFSGFLGNLCWLPKIDTASPSNQGLLCCSSAKGIDSADESEYSKLDDSSEEDEEEGGDGGGLPAQMLYRGVVDSWKKEYRSNPGVDGSLKRLWHFSLFGSPELRLLWLLFWGRF